MNSPDNIPSAEVPGSNRSAEAALKDLDATLSLIAKLPVPAGLADRVFAGALASPRNARVIEWPQPFYARDWVRAFAAAAIVFAVGGGGWGIYAHVERNEPARVTVTPRPMFQPGGFSSAEVIRRPQTLNGPVVKKAEPARTAKTTAQAKMKNPATAHGRHSAKIQPAQAGAPLAK